MRQEAPIPTEIIYYVKDRGFIFMTLAMGLICTNPTWKAIEIKSTERKKPLLKRPEKILFSLGRSFLALISLKIWRNT
jgi:hypothetical protein